MTVSRTKFVQLRKKLIIIYLTLKLKKPVNLTTKFLQNHAENVKENESASNSATIKELLDVLRGWP